MLCRVRLARSLPLALVLAGCATRPPAPALQRIESPVPPVVAAPQPVAPIQQAGAARPGFDRLAGWSQENHAAALDAFDLGCGASHDLAMAIVCHDARALGHLEEAPARQFLEQHFRPEPIGSPGLLTGYFTPIYEARASSGGEFSAPVRPRPADLPAADTAPASDAAYPDREAIERRSTRGALAWMRPEDLFFLQIQGSGVLVFPDGSRKKAVFDGSNGAPFRGIAAPMRQQGLLSADAASAEAIRSWLAAHRGGQAAALMDLDPRYVFFRLVADDGAPPTGAAGVALVSGRSAAVDLSSHELGEFLWVDATSPTLSSAFPVYRRLAMALDTGGAIKGEARADLYIGMGQAAGVEAGRIRHVLRLYRMVPLEQPAP